MWLGRIRSACIHIDSEKLGRDLSLERKPVYPPAMRLPVRSLVFVAVSAALVTTSATAEKTPALAGLLRHANEDFGRSAESASIFQNTFIKMAGDIASILGPRKLGPSTTSGSLGFDLGVDIALSTVDEGSAHWANALPGDDGLMNTVALQFRKGLPFGFELGGDVAHLADSDLWALGLNLKYTFLEGYSYLPEAALRVGFWGVAGSRELDLVIISTDLAVSKEFGLGGVVAIAPYFTYGLLVAMASTNVVGYFPAGEALPVNGVVPTQTITVNRGGLGFRLLFPYSALSVEAVFSPGVQTYTTSVSLVL